VHDPEVLILDEPFSGLDPVNAQALKDTVLELKRRGRTVIFSTHMVDNAERMCDAVCIIAGGEKVLDGPVAEVRGGSNNRRHVALSLAHAPQNGVVAVLNDARLVKRVDDSNRFFEIELADGADAQELLRRVLATGAAVERFEVVGPSLHRIFLERVGATGVETGMSGNG
jgi:ABC-2 type transport system ATP-binding protein